MSRVRDQAPLTTSTGGIWLVVGGLFAAISIAVLLVLRASLGTTGAVAVGVLYIVIVVARFAAHGRVRLWIMAWSMIAMAVVALGCVLAVAWASY